MRMQEPASPAGQRCCAPARWCSAPSSTATRSLLTACRPTGHSVSGWTSSTCGGAMRSWCSPTPATMTGIYKLLEEGLWWPLLAGKRLTIVRGQADELAARLLDAGFVRATDGGEISWTVASNVGCPPVYEPKRHQWRQTRDDLFAADCDRRMRSAGSLSAVRREVARNARRSGRDIGSLDTRLNSLRSFGGSQSCGYLTRAATKTVSPSIRMQRDRESIDTDG